MKLIFYFLSSFLISATACTHKTEKLPVDLKFHFETITRKGNFGDNWCQTWAADDHIYCMLDDGNGWWGNSEKTKNLYDWSGSMCLQIQGDEDFGTEDVKKIEGWPENPANSPLYADRPENRTYGFKLSPKWISDDGEKMILIWSDAGDDHSTNYKWNQMQIEFTF